MENTALSEVLDGPEPVEDNEMDTLSDDGPKGPENEEIPPGMCIECGDQPSTLFCKECKDDFCAVCFQAQHRRGTRSRHETQEHAPVVTEQPAAPAEEEEGDEEEVMASGAVQLIQQPTSQVGEWYVERGKYIPLRLTLHERKGALNVSEYTDKIDIYTYRHKPRRIHAQIIEMCSILSGLVVASDYKLGQKLIKDRNFAENEDWFKQIFEIGRRHKIMNPDKMRSEYGKLIYMLMDSQEEDVKELLGFDCVRPVLTVHRFLKQYGVEDVLRDPHIMAATMEIKSAGKNRYQIQREIKQKEAAVEHLAHKYSASGAVEPDAIRRCLYSIGDNHAFLGFSRDPVHKMIAYLKHYFSPDAVEDGFSLAIQGGFHGARLTHSHTRQFYYVFQSLQLWHDIIDDFFKLWWLSEHDLLQSVYGYRLTDTGQGLNRVQDAPHVSKAVHSILHHTQEAVGHWVGSSVVHLGDHNVPNALMFIDKYTQVPRIIRPIVLCLDEIGNLMKDDHLATYINTTFGGAEKLKKIILQDFFRHAFDGSGADNFFDAGSCIDGRLTSAWQWCTKLEKKSYHPIFKLCGFNGFDGDFQR